MKEYEVLQVDADASIEKMVQRLDNLQKMVDTPKVVAAAINSAARSTKNKIVKDTKERYATANDSVYSSSSALKVDAATGGDLTATLHSSGSMQEIMDFDSKPNSGTSAAARVLSSSGMKSLEHNGLKAFLVQFSSGHKAIVQRVPGETYTSAGASKRAQKWGAKSDMTRIEKLLSPSAPQMFGNPDTVDPALERASEILDKQMEKQIEKALE